MQRSPAHGGEAKLPPSGGSAGAGCQWHPRAWPAGSIGELLAVAFLLDERRNARALRDVFRLQRAAKCGRRGRERNAARSRLAKGIFSFGMKPDERAKRALLERRPFARKLARKKSLLNARRQRSAYAPSSPPCDYGQSLHASRRNTSLRSGSCPSAEQRAQQVACCPRSRGKWPAGPKGVHGRTGKDNT